MSTKALIDRILPHASGWNRIGTRSILDLIQRGQDELWDYDSPSMRFISTDNKGFPPYLETTAGTYKYEITEANISATLSMNIGGTNYAVRAKNVIQIFVDVSSTDYNKRWIGEPFVHYYPNPYSTDISRTVVATVAHTAFPALENTAAYVIFKEDPGTETEKYFVEFTYETPRLTAETIPLSVPLVYETALRDYAMGEIQMLSNGKINEYQTKFEQYWKPRFRTEMAQYRQHNNHEVVPRIC